MTHLAVAKLKDAETEALAQKYAHALEGNKRITVARYRSTSHPWVPALSHLDSSALTMSPERHRRPIASPLKNRKSSKLICQRANTEPAAALEAAHLQRKTSGRRLQSKQPSERMMKLVAAQGQRRSCALAADG